MSEPETPEPRAPTAFDPARYLTRVSGKEEGVEPGRKYAHSDRGKPKSPEHRAKISATLKSYNKSGGHLAQYRKSGEEHPNWQGGIRTSFYQERAFTAYGRQCNRCGDTESRLLVHHIDRNRRNADVSNLEVLCHACHMTEHHGKRVDWTCPTCGTALSLIPYLAQRRKYCSQSCRMASRAKNGTFTKERGNDRQARL
jgi:hypothetical protein